MNMSAVIPEISIDENLINTINNQIANDSVLNIFKIDFGKLIEVVKNIQLPEWVGEVFPNLLPKTSTTTTTTTSVGKYDKIKISLEFRFQNHHF